jgi:glutathione S-transferase
MLFFYRYIADKFDSPLYPKDLKKRALVNSRLDYFLTEVYPPIGYEVVYPQFLPHHKVNFEILILLRANYTTETLRRVAKSYHRIRKSKGCKDFASNHLTFMSVALKYSLGSQR